MENKSRGEGGGPKHLIFTVESATSESGAGCVSSFKDAEYLNCDGEPQETHDNSKGCAEGTTVN